MNCINSNGIVSEKVELLSMNTELCI